jgi:glycosyltransferase involved in cell wall biosynthesis
MRAADAFIFPSLYEGFGGSLIEAMATGLPLIASDLSPVREVVGEAGILVPPADWRSLATAMRRLALDRTEAEALGSAGLARFQSNFRLDMVLSDMADLFWETAHIARSEVHGGRA